MPNRSADPAISPPKNTFPKRYYQSWSVFWRDISFLLSNRDRIKAAMASPKINWAFRERLMLAVTKVNGCRYCRTFHVGQAKQAGISIDEITEYLKGNIPDSVPEEQKLAVCYAQHWAETDRQPDPDYVTQVLDTYGEEGYHAISMALRMIWMGNLLGNTADFVLYKISFGRWGT